MADSIWDVIFGENRFEPNKDFDIFGYKDEYAPQVGTKSVPFYEQERQYKTLPEAPDITIDPFRFNVYKPISTDSLSRHGNVSVPMTLQGIMQSFTGGLDTLLDAGGSIPTTATEKPLEDIGVMDFNVYNAYKGQHAKQPFTEAFKEANLFAMPRETEQKMREYSGASDLFKFGGNIASGGLAFKTLTNKVFSDAVNFGVPGLTFDLEDPNFGQIFQELGADGEFVNWLAGDGKNETTQARIEQRLKNALTETGLGYLVEQGVRIVRNAKELVKNPEYRDKVIDETLQPLVDQRSPTERINESLYNITALNNDNRHLVNIAPSPGTKLFPGEKGIRTPQERTNKELAELEYKQNEINGIVSPYQQQRIWEKYGWARDTDGSMYFEIDDRPALLNTQVFADNLENWKDFARVDYDAKPYTIDGRKEYPTTIYGEETNLTLKDVLKHDELYQRYPEIANVPVDLVYGVQARDMSSGREIGLVTPDVGDSGSYSPRDNRIRLPIDQKTGALDPDALSTILHETQHIIQLREGFQSGGNVSKPWWNVVKRQIIQDQVDMFGKNYGEYQKLRPVQQYAYDKQNLKYYEELAKRDNLTGIARHINNVYIREVDEALRNVPVPKKGKTEEYNDYLRLKAETIADYYKKQTLPIEMGGRDDAKEILKAYNSIKAKDKTKSIDRQIQKLIPDTHNWKRAQKIIEEIDDVINRTTHTTRDVIKNREEIFNLYKRLQGEVQARNVERRLKLGSHDSVDFDPTKVSPIKTQDISDESKITFPQQHYIKDIPINREGDSLIDMTINDGDFDDFSVLNLKKLNEQPTKELAPLDEGGYFMKSAQVLMDDPREVYKQPNLLAQVNKKGEIVGELVNKGVKVDELKESGLLGYLNTKQHLGEPVTKQELLDFIERKRPKISSDTSFKEGSPHVEIDVNMQNPKHHFDEETGTFKGTDAEKYEMRVLPYHLNTIGGSRAKNKLGRDLLIGKDRSERLTIAKGILQHLNRDDISPEDIVNHADDNPLDIANLRSKFNINRVDFHEALEKLASEEYKKNPTVRWKVPVHTDTSRMFFEVEGTLDGKDLEIYKLGETGKYDYFVDEAPTFEEAQVRMQEYVRTSTLANDGYGVNWFDYVQGNTDPLTYREIIVRINQEGQVVPDIHFHSMAGRSAEDTRNMIGHLRIDNRIDKQGRKHTHSLEHQSDWSQKARQYGVTEGEYKTKLENVDKNIDKVSSDIKKVETIRKNARREANKSQSKLMPHNIVGDKFTKRHALRSKLGGEKITQPMMDDYIKRVGRFVLDNSFDNKTFTKSDDGTYIFKPIIKSNGEIDKITLGNEFHKDIIRSAKHMYFNNVKSNNFLFDIDNEIDFSPEGIRQRFIDGKPTIDDLQIARRVGDTIHNRLSDISELGEFIEYSGTDKYNFNLPADVMGHSENVLVNGKSTNLFSLNETLNRKIQLTSSDIWEEAFNNYTKEEGIKGDSRKLRDKLLDKKWALENKKGKLESFGRGIGGTKPALIHKDRHVKLLLKELIKQGIKDGSDVVSWTPSQNQIDLWGEGQAQLFKNTYDKDSKKFGNEILKDYGLDQQVQTKGATIDYGTHRGSGKEQGERDVMYIELTPELKQAVLNEEKGMKISHNKKYTDRGFRQPLYTVPPIGLFGMEQQDSDKMNKKQGLLQ